jgi:hypothetical protein
MSVSITLSDVPTHIVFWKGNAEKESDLVKTLVDRIAKLEEMVGKLLDRELLSGLSMRRREDSIGSLAAVNESDMKNLFKELIERPLTQEIESESILDTAFDLGDDFEEEDAEGTDAEGIDAEEAEGTEEEEVHDDEVHDDEVHDDEVEEEEVEVEEEEEEVEPDAEGTEQEPEVDAEGIEVEPEVDAEGTEQEPEVEEEEEEEEALELDEFEYKGVTYFRDSENQVYQVDVDGDLDDTPIGVWSVEKAKVLKYAK